MSKLLDRASKSLGRTAVVANKQSYSYGRLLAAADAISSNLTKLIRTPCTTSGTAGLATPPRVGLYAVPGPEYLAATWAVWRAGGIIVPLATSHPPPELSYVCQDAGVSVVLAPHDQESKLGPVAHQHGVPLQVMEPLKMGPATAATRASSSRSSTNSTNSSASSSTREVSAEAAEAEAEAEAIIAELSDLSASDPSGALIIYTSGTTGRPKGALHTHRSLQAQVWSLASAWRWRPSDRLLHVLPLHHIHGIVNGLYCPAAVGACVEFATGCFKPAGVWERLQSGDVSVFMGVPTMYSYLLSYHDAAIHKPRAQERMRAAAALRLTVSGSSACPVPIMNRWRELSGNYLLERYGMTEIGMALSNPYQGERRPGSVGVPLPGVETRLDTEEQLLVRGPTLFSEYWGRPEATASAFDAEGFFLTGDTASTSGTPPYFSIEGRTSVDIIKSSGFKISALQIESVILEHPEIEEVAVLGVPDDILGEEMTALVVARRVEQGSDPGGQAGGGAAEEATTRPDAGELQRFCKERLASYQVPKRWQWVSALPRNAMGKINKKELLRMLQAGQLS